MTIQKKKVVTDMGIDGKASGGMEGLSAEISANLKQNCVE